MSIPGLPAGIATATTGLKGGMDSLTGKAGSACDIFGTLGTMVSLETSALFAGIQRGITDAMKTIGGVIKNITDMIDGVMSKVQAFMSKIGELAASAIAKINGVIAKVGAMISDAIGQATAVISDLIGMIDDMASALGKAVRAMIAKGCSLVKGAASAIGDGVSSMLDTVKSEAPFPAEASIKAAADKALGTAGQSKTALDSITFDSDALSALDGI